MSWGVRARMSRVERSGEKALEGRAVVVRSMLERRARMGKSIVRGWIRLADQNEGTDVALGSGRTPVI